MRWWHPDSTFACAGDAEDAAPELHLGRLPGGSGGLPGRHRRGLHQQERARSPPSAARRLCAPCVRYIQGYELGAKSVNPNIVVKTPT